MSITLDEQIEWAKRLAAGFNATEFSQTQITSAILATLERIKAEEAGLPVEQLNVDSALHIWSMRPQPTTSSGRAWEDGARKGWSWRNAYVEELRAYAAQKEAELKFLKESFIPKIQEDHKKTMLQSSDNWNKKLNAEAENAALQSKLNADSEFIAKAFQAHPNLDLDIEAIDQARKP